MASVPDSSNNKVTFEPSNTSSEPRGFLAQTGHELSEAAQHPVDGAIGAVKGTLGLPWDIMDLAEVIENKGRDALGWITGRDIPHYKNELKKPEILEPSNDAQRGGDKATLILGAAGIAKGLAKQGIKVTKRLAKGADDAAEAAGDAAKVTDDLSKSSDDLSDVSKAADAARSAKLASDDPSAMLKDGKLDFDDVQDWANGKQNSNVWVNNTNKFPDGGFKYKSSDGSYDYSIHGHGPNPQAPAGTYSSSNPTASITRKPVGGGQYENMRSDGTWGSPKADPAGNHIPLDNSPYGKQ